MVWKVKDTEQAAELFGDWQETIIWSCLQNMMGAVYVDDPEKTSAAMAVLGDFCFYAGEPNRELIRFLKEGIGQKFIIMVPQNEKWGRMIEECYGNQARAVKRYAFKKEAGGFQEENLRRFSDSLGPDYEIKMIGKDLFEACRAESWSRDLVGQFSDHEEYERIGIGTAVLYQGTLVSGASAYSRYRDGIEIEIDTKEEFRRRGLASACGARLILECLARGLYPSWDAQNPGSAALAEKLGYRFDREYLAYEVDLDGTRCPLYTGIILSQELS